MFKQAKAITVLAFAAALSSCGGGGEEPAAPAAKGYPVAQAFKDAYQRGFQRTYNGVQGAGRSPAFPFDSGVTGSLTSATVAALPVTFNGSNGYQSTSNISGTVTLNNYNQTFPLSVTGIEYLNSDYRLIGSDSLGQYCIATSPGDYPTTISDTPGIRSGAIVTYTCFADSTKTTVTGTETLSYEASQNIIGTLNFTITNNIFNTAGTLINSSTSYYTITYAGVLTLQKKIFSTVSNGYALTIAIQ